MLGGRLQRIVGRLRHEEIEDEHMHAHLPSFILARSHVELPFSLYSRMKDTLESIVALEDARNGFKYPAELRIVFVEHHDSCFAVAPSQVAKKLVDSLRQLLLAFLYFALSDECGSVAILDANICLAASSKGLPGSVALIVTIQVR